MRVRTQCAEFIVLVRVVQTVFHSVRQSLRSVEEFARAILSKNVAVDVLINNAGIMFGPRAETDDGHESQFGVNHLVC